jgi:hypothetical protein
MRLNVRRHLEVDEDVPAGRRRDAQLGGSKDAGG